MEVEVEVEAACVAHPRIVTNDILRYMALAELFIFQKVMT